MRPVSSPLPLPISERKLLDRAQTYLQSFVARHAAAIDTDPEVLRVALQGLGDLALLALKVPRAWQGAEFSLSNYYCYQESLARYSGALAFLQTQHQSAGALIARGTNESLKLEFLPRMGTGKVLVGIAFSHLRRPGEPMLRAEPTQGGYQLNGHIPWITGYDFFQDFIVGATLPSGEILYGAMPLREMVQPSGGKLNFSAPLPLIAMESAQTASARVDEWFLPEERVVAIRSPNFLGEQDRKNVLYPSSLALGCARGGLDLLQKVSQQKELPFLEKAYNALDRDWEDCRQQIFDVLASQDTRFELRLELRSRAIDLAGRCARAAVIASGGSASTQSHPAGRIYRESLLFAVSGQTPDLMEAALGQLLPSL
ncbi:acyl-CoA dehydrogenase family protein [Oscillatoria sp. FACHB-1406]|uniref:acyl-CoA dehydrogenase family protein n=1 Tax=Oscillatoria sp. FACHB-1406 TaxID=2692846 RepID=UPI003220457F